MLSTIFAWIFTGGMLYTLKHFGFLVFPVTMFGIANPTVIILIAGTLFYTAQYLAGSIYAHGSLFLINHTGLSSRNSRSKGLIQIIGFPFFLIFAFWLILKLMTMFGVFTLVWSTGLILILVGYGLLQIFFFVLSALVASS